MVPFPVLCQCVPSHLESDRSGMVPDRSGTTVPQTQSEIDLE